MKHPKHPLPESPDLVIASHPSGQEGHFPMTGVHGTVEGYLCGIDLGTTIGYIISSIPTMP
jgi:hypothetical protein